METLTPISQIQMITRRMNRFDNLLVQGLQMAKYLSTEMADNVSTETVTEVV